MADAATIKPKFVPDNELLPRDDSLGPDMEPHTGQFGDGGYVFGGAKSYLSAGGGRSGVKGRTEETREPRERVARRAAERAN